MQLHRFSTSAEFVAASAALVKAACAGSSHPAYVALSGGSTPLPVYAALAADPGFDVEAVEWFLVDERYVPRDHADSTYAAVVKAFGAAEPFFSDHFHWFDTERPIVEALAAYEKDLDQVPGGQFDLIVLGIGRDGHTASLFPGGPENLEAERRVLHVINEKAPTPPVRDRLTITWPVILAAKQILVLVTGAEKEGIAQELVEGTKAAPGFPPARLREHRAVTVHFVS